MFQEFQGDLFYFFWGSVVAEKKKTERKTEGRSHWARGSVRMPLFLALICCFWARERNGQRICFVLGERAEERACAPFRCRWCYWVMFGAREGVRVRKRGKRKRPPLLPLVGRDFYHKKRIRDVIFLYPLTFLDWWSDRRLTAVFAKNGLTTISFSCRGWWHPVYEKSLIDNKKA